MNRANNGNTNYDNNPNSIDKLNIHSKNISIQEQLNRHEQRLKQHEQILKQHANNQHEQISHEQRLKHHEQILKKHEKGLKKMDNK